MTTLVATTITCTRCQRESAAKLSKAAEAKLPRGWKRWPDESPICDKCWHTAYALRAITVPVAGPVGIEWADLRVKTDAAFHAATGLSNWAIREYVRSDHVRVGNAPKLEPMPPNYLYPGARAAFPEMDPNSVVSLLQSVERKWRATRFDVIHRRAAAPPSYRWPTPYPLNAKSWSVQCEEGGATVVSVRLMGDLIGLRVRGGPDFRRQVGLLRRVAEGELPYGEAALMLRTVSESSHRPEVSGVDGKRSRLMLKLCVWVPKSGPRERTGALHVRTSGTSLWTYHIDDGEPRFLYADQVRRWIAEHDDRMGRLAHDSKYEKRWPSRVRRGMAERREAWSGKHANRLDSFMHEASAMLAGYAERRGVSEVEYDDTDRSYLPGHFGWARLRALVAEKLDVRGITLVAKGATSDE